jgi:hypothetical protein
MTQRIVCAAIRAANGELLLGIRHYSKDMQTQIASRVDGNKFKNILDDGQGFVDQHGKFISRLEAYKIAKENGQLLYPERCGMGMDGPKLYSEGLY